MQIRVLVAYASFAVAIALARRLVDFGFVALAHHGAFDCGHGDGDHGDERAYDVVVLCPYLPPERRDALIARYGADPRLSALVVLHDGPQGQRVDMRARDPRAHVIDSLRAALATSASAAR